MDSRNTEHRKISRTTLSALYSEIQRTASRDTAASSTPLNALALPFYPRNSVLPKTEENTEMAKLADMAAITEMTETPKKAEDPATATTSASKSTSTSIPTSDLIKRLHNLPSEIYSQIFDMLFPDPLAHRTIRIDHTYTPPLQLLLSKSIRHDLSSKYYSTCRFVLPDPLTMVKWLVSIPREHRAWITRLKLELKLYDDRIRYCDSSMEIVGIWTYPDSYGFYERYVGALGVGFEAFNIEWREEKFDEKVAREEMERVRELVGKCFGEEMERDRLKRVAHQEMVRKVVEMMKKGKVEEKEDETARKERVRALMENGSVPDGPL